MLAALLEVQVSEATARRQAESDGAAYVAVQTEAVTKIEKELPASPVGAKKQLMSVDGAIVPLVGGEWAEVKTLVLGVIAEPVIENDELVVHARELSYFSRLTNADTFSHLALVETHRRGVETADQVGAVVDGAVWIQGFIDYHCPDAVRILDFPHAAEYINDMGVAVWGSDSPTTAEWSRVQRHRLKHQGAGAVLPTVRALTAAHAELPELAEKLAYLEKRESQMKYPVYQAQGWPIGSGAVESGNKLVVQARLKGAGMHWARDHVNPMLGLRNAVCNDRWDEAWPQITSHRHQQREQQRQARRERNLAATIGPSAQARPTQLASLPPTPPADKPRTRVRHRRRPSLHHPWRKYPTGKARRRSSPRSPAAK